MKSRRLPLFDSIQYNIGHYEWRSQFNWYWFFLPLILEVSDLQFYNAYKLQVEYSFQWTNFYEYILLNFSHEAYNNIPQFLSYKDLFPQCLKLSHVFTVQSLQRYTVPCIWVWSCWAVYHFLLLSRGCLGFDT